MLRTRAQLLARAPCALCAAVAAVACGSQAATEPVQPPVAGTYVLQTVNDAPLPAQTFSSHASWQVAADTLVLRTDGTCADKTRQIYVDIPLTGRNGYASDWLMSTGCTWVARGGTVTMTLPPEVRTGLNAEWWAGPAQQLATASGGMFTLAQQGQLWT